MSGREGFGRGNSQNERHDENYCCNGLGLKRKIHMEKEKKRNMAPALIGLVGAK